MTCCSVARRVAPLLCLSLVVAASGCRRRAGSRAVATIDAGAGACPSADALAALVKEPGRFTRTDCVVYAPGMFWLAVALTAAEKPPSTPKLSLLSGGGGMSPVA